MAGHIRMVPKMVEAFHHDRLGLVLVMRTITVIDGGEPHDFAEPFYLRASGGNPAASGDPEYLEQVTAHIQEHWVDGDKPTFSAN